MKLFGADKEDAPKSVFGEEGRIPEEKEETIMEEKGVDYLQAVRHKKWVVTVRYEGSISMVVSAKDTFAAIEEAKKQLAPVEESGMPFVVTEVNAAQPAE